MVGLELAWQTGCQLGEGPVWLEQSGELAFVDINRGALHFHDPKTGSNRTLKVGGQPSFLLPARDGRLIVGSGHGLYGLSNEELGECLIRVPQPEGNRTNDATVAPYGRIWFGTMDDTSDCQQGACGASIGATCYPQIFVRL